MYKDTEIQLGFVEEVPSEEMHVLYPEYLPSKVGGKPSWIGGPFLDKMASSCPKCDKIMPLLVQIYAPLEEVNDQAYHRMLFVLCCKDPACHKEENQPFRVFRAQLPRDNIYLEDIDEDDDDQQGSPNDDDFLYLNAICELCGWKARKHCSQCQNIRYCDKEHQILDWKNGHKELCSETEKRAIPVLPTQPQQPIRYKRMTYNDKEEEKQIKNKLLFAEYEIVTEREDPKISATIDKLQLQVDVDAGRVEAKEDEKMEEESVPEIAEEYADLVGEDDEEEGEEEEQANPVDPSFTLFQQITEHSPEQILRYSFGNLPLWIGEEKRPEEVPACSCGSPRTFEFQILPQLLYFLSEEKGVPSIDWGTLLVYSCVNSCSLGNDELVKEEFIWNQGFEQLKM